MKQSDIELQLNNNILTIKGKIEESAESEEKNYFMRERYYGSFQRSITLPNNVIEDNIDATFKDGILNITINKKPGSSIKKIEVKTK